MTYSELFSKRYNLRPTPEGLMYEDVPNRARVGFYHIVEQYFDEWDKRAHLAYLELYKNICVALRIPRDRRVDAYFHASLEIEKLISNVNFWQFYDICQVVWDTLSSSNFSRDQREFSEQVNMLFQEERLGFEMREGKVEKVGSGFIDAKIKEARYLLKESEFKGADEHFEKAMKALNERPKPDVENCIKDSVAAIESVGRVIVGDEKALLSEIINKAVRSEVIPKPLDQTFQKVYAYRGNEPGVAHGAVDASKVTEAEAELILAMSAAMIIYLVKKRSKLETI